MHCTYGKPSVREKIYIASPALTESIYNLIPTTEVRQEKIPRYKSIYSDSVREFYECQKLPCKTMGCYKLELPSPKRFLKKHTRENKFLEIQKRCKDVKPPQSYMCSHPERSPRKPAVPKHDEKPVIMLNTPKNFIKENIRNAARGAAKKPVPKVIDSKKGHLILLEFSGLVPKYLQKKEYGKTPNYLIMMRQDMEHSREKYEAYVREQMEKGLPKRIGENEKQELLAGLKKNWTEINREYASIPLKIDTIRKKAHKESLEEKLKSLETDIELLEKHDEIYILDQ